MTNSPRFHQRSAAEAHGRRSETLAAWALRLKGYRILGRRLKTPLGEIDMVAARPFGPVCFIEVKARAAHDAAVLSVGQGQRARIARAASLYLAGRPDLRGRGARFDIIAVAPGRWPRHHADAWRADDL
ncbi:MAG: YraN family protein [Alphaproteobacteria bacterium]|nr:YraN family protein [Alphaproteobacteria bacterium]